MATQTGKLYYNRVTDTWKKMPELLCHWNINWTSRKHLLELDDSQLRDIGVDRISAEQEARKPFWQK